MSQVQSNVSGPIAKALKICVVIALIYLIIQVIGPAGSFIEAAGNAVGSVLNQGTALLNDLSAGA